MSLPLTDADYATDTDTYSPPSKQINWKNNKHASLKYGT